MTRDQFKAAIVRSPDPGSQGEVVFDFHDIPNTPCSDFRYTTTVIWDSTGSALDECWEAFVDQWVTDWID